MGNIIPLDADKKDEIEDIAKDFLGTFSTEFVKAYGVEYARTKLAEIDEESYKEEKAKRELTYGKETNPDPVKQGYLIKQGAVVKNWKKRYFVAKPDHSIEYYESQEAFEKGFKFKGAIYPAGYKVEEDADSAIVERLKAVAKQLGVDEKDLPLPEKYPEHTFELAHETRRPYYITAENEEDKKEWLQVIKNCCEKVQGFRNPDPISRVAFKNAYRRACWEACCRHYSENSGTEEQVLTNSIVYMIDQRVMTDVYYNLSTMPGGYMVRKKVREQVIKTLNSLVTAMVIPSYKGQVEATQKMNGPLDNLVNEKKDSIIEAQKKLTQTLSEKLYDKFAVVFDDVKQAVATMESELNEAIKKSIPVIREYLFVKVVDQIIEMAKDNDDIEASLPKYFKTITRSWRAKRDWYHFYNSLRPILEIYQKHKETFDISCGRWTLVNTALDIMAEVEAAAGFTFKELFNELSKGTDALKNGKTASEIMVTTKDQVLPKFDADAIVAATEASFKITHDVVVECIMEKLKPVSKDLLRYLKQTLPDPINKVISVQDRYEMYVDQIAKQLINKAIGVENNAEAPKEKTEETPEENKPQADAQTAEKTKDETKSSIENKVSEQVTDENTKEEPEKPAQNDENKEKLEPTTDL